MQFVKKNLYWILAAAIVLPLLWVFVQSGVFSTAPSVAPTANDNAATKLDVAVDVPAFNADSTYAYVAKQVSFGFRETGTKGNKACGDWAVAKFKTFGATVTEQLFTAKFYDKSVPNARNIIASYNPDAPNRVFIAAHWDTRQMAEEDTEGKDKPILGVDDGASGVAVLLELARILQQQPLGKDLGVDLIMLDAEDRGQNDGEATSWCVGSQYWAANPHRAGYRAKYGILLDMVGAKGASFPKEATSQKYAADIQNHIWSVAAGAGFGAYFPNQTCNGVIDDHAFINDIAHIPTVDIISLDLSPGNGSYHFGAHHHTHKDDNLGIIDKQVLKAVGQSVAAVIYREAAHPL